MSRSQIACVLVVPITLLAQQRAGGVVALERHAQTGRFPEAVAPAQRALLPASARNNDARITTLKKRLECYEGGSPFRDVALTNRPRPAP